MGISRYSVIFSLLVAIFAISVSTVSAQVVEVSVSTDKAVYYEGEPIQIFVTAYNPNPYPVTLNFSTSCQGDYTIDDVLIPRICKRVGTSVDIPPYDSYTWNFVHTEEFFFSVPVGNHTVIGVVSSVEFYGLSEPVTIAVTSNGWNCAVNNETGTDRYNCTTHLDQGWNLVSIPLEQDDWSIGVVLSSIEGNYTGVYAFMDGVWKYKLARNPLTYMDMEHGYWIEMAAPDTLELNGTVPPATTINVTTGWNLVGYPSLTTRTITDVLSSINYTSVYAYIGGVWKFTTARNPLTEMTPGYGYWIDVNEAGSYEVN